jgi:hypothetical protein
MAGAEWDSSNRYIYQQVEKDITVETGGDQWIAGGPVPPAWWFSARADNR